MKKDWIGGRGEQFGIDSTKQLQAKRSKKNIVETTEKTYPWKIDT